MTDEPVESGIVGFYYWEIPEGSNPNDITEEQKTYIAGTTGAVKIPSTKEGKITIGIQARDKAGNRTEETKMIVIHKDSSAPLDFLPSIEEGSRKIDGFTITAGTTDAVSGISHYNFYVKLGDTIVKELKNDATGRFAVTGLEQGTIYNISVEAVDKAGNVKSGAGITGATIANTPPTRAVVSFNSKGTNYIQINAKSTDIDGDKLTYTLRYGTSSSNLNYSTQLSNQTQNVQVAIQTPTNLSQYTYYYWRVDVSDGKVTTEGDIQTQVRTYCSGTGYTCNGPFVQTNGKACTASGCVNGKIQSICGTTLEWGRASTRLSGSCPHCGYSSEDSDNGAEYWGDVYTLYCWRHASKTPRDCYV